VRCTRAKNDTGKVRKRWCKASQSAGSPAPISPTNHARAAAGDVTQVEMHRSAMEVMILSITSFASEQKHCNCRIYDLHFCDSSLENTTAPSCYKAIPEESKPRPMFSKFVVDMTRFFKCVDLHWVVPLNSCTNDVLRVGSEQEWTEFTLAWKWSSRFSPSTGFHPLKHGASISLQ
jgi:hypothetical protein